MKKVIVSNATPIIAFAKINRLELFQKIVGEVIIPEEVSKELFSHKKSDIKKLDLCKWIKV